MALNVQDEGPVQVMLNENIGYGRANLHDGEYDKTWYLLT